ncbi:uncharacterized protein LOC126213167 isoform X5 [Schistocerca nitens]|uniref:uncharacterized protein LOC126213167 isoform X5 n=1 Tax=Schistocerca nitens TaxID=7011 RepID=UPI002117D014|nr:uncharacterized protein LOC126213167 isoform X5 [Schistocerca nitens]
MDNEVLTFTVLRCITAVMGDTKTVWLEKEEIDEFPEDPLKFEKLDFNMNEGPELNFHLDASEHNHVEVPFVLPVPTHIKEDPELNLEAEETENIIDAYTEFCIHECDPARIEKEKAYWNYVVGWYLDLEPYISWSRTKFNVSDCFKPLHMTLETIRWR